MSRLKKLDIFNCPLRPGGYGRKPQREPIKFWPILPMKLKNTVSGKTERLSESMCLQEMTVMLSCLKRNEFDQVICSKEVQEFSQCNQLLLDRQKLRSKQDQEGFVAAGEKRLPFQQLNRFLKKYPQPRDNK